MTQILGVGSQLIQHVMVKHEALNGIVGNSDNLGIIELVI